MDKEYEGEAAEEDLRHLEDEAAEGPDDAHAEGQRAVPAQAGVAGSHEPLYRVKILHSNETLLAARDPERPLAPGAMVIVATRYGKDLAELLGEVLCPGATELGSIVAIDRDASDEDLRRYADNAEREKEAFSVAQRKIASHNLPMKLVSTHYLLDEPKVLFFFTAESRVDFRELVKDLVGVFKMRIELRQIGVRDEARVTGGLGVCGRGFCCHSVTDKLNPVSIKMAKDQNLSLNSMKISGPCGRLLCCLAYEYGFYREERRGMPQEGARFLHEGVNFKVIEVNVLGGMVRLAGEDNRLLELPARRFAKAEGHWKILPEEEPPKDE